MATSQLNSVVDDKTSNPAGQKLPGRLMSLDVFRGATIAAMILVNDPGDGPSSYWPLKHSEWNGWTPTDLVFPFFLFIVGVAMAFSLPTRLQRGESRQKLLLHVLWRGVLLFAIGMFLNGFPNHYQLGSWRVYGVLQRIAICYVIAAILELWFSWRQQLAVIAVCLVGYWVLMRYVPVPGLGVPTHDFPLLDPDRNLAAWLDRKVLAGHLYEGTRDPEGILSTIPAIATALLGLLTGKWFRARQSDAVKVWGLLTFGVIGVAMGMVMNIWFPINKKLWTSSYVVFTAGLALIFLAICYQVLDLKRWRGRWTVPFLVFGMNSIAAYVFSEIVAHLLDRLTVQSAGGRIPWQDAIYQRFFLPLASPPNASLLYALVYVFVCWIVMYVLYRKRIFLKI
jgi:predicted acyltransferase